MEQMKISHAEIILFERLIENEIDRIVNMNEMFGIPNEVNLSLELKKLESIKSRLNMAKHFYPIS